MNVRTLTGMKKLAYIETLVSDENQLRMCQQLAFPGGVLDEDFIYFVENSLLKCKFLFLATCGNRPMAFLCAFDHTFKTKLAGRAKSICKKDELYLDIVCGERGTGAGKAVISALFTKAKNLGKKKIRLFAVESALPYWYRLGFRETENACKSNASFTRYRYPLDPDAGVRMTMCLADVKKGIFKPSCY